MSTNPSTERCTITGVILAGGLGRRMGAAAGGLDKGLLPFGGRPMVAQVIDRLAPQVGSLAINANRHHDRWHAFGLPVFADEIEGFAGPLAGLHAALGRVDTAWVATAPCDAPFLPLDLVARLARAASAQGARIAIARTADRQHPVFALVDRSLREDLQRYLESGQRRVQAWMAGHGAAEVAFDDEAAFRNLNTTEDLAYWAPAGVPADPPAREHP
ncbi:MAG: molybdenum cofactor guanylyltransferase MobA [Burkholderiaceae bacterium]